MQGGFPQTVVHIEAHSQIWEASYRVTSKSFTRRPKNQKFGEQAGELPTIRSTH